MTKDQCEAIIRAIQETTNFIMTNGITIRDRISDPAEDADYVQALLTTYGAAIDAIINNIPDD